MKIAVCGAGAMGGRFGAMLHKSGNDITFIDTWDKHIHEINLHGLRVETLDENYYCPVKAYLPQDVSGSFDLVLFLTKAMNLESMIQSISHVIDSNTALMVLSNGLGNIENLEKYGNTSPIYAGVTLWSSELEGPGHIKITGDGNIEFQGIRNTNESLTHKLEATLNKAGLNAISSSNVVYSIWKKAAFNSVLNTYCALLDCNVGAFGSCNNAMTLATAVVSEFETISQAKAIPFNKEDVLETIAKAFDPSTSGHHYPSMHQDLKNGRKTEIDFLNGAISRFGRELNIETPTNTLLQELIHSKETLTA